MKKTVILLLAVCMLFSMAAGGSASAESEFSDWTREGYYTDEDENMLSVTWMDDIDEPGWFVGFMNGEDFIEDSYGGTLPQDGNTLHGTLASSGEKGELTVTISEEGENGLLLVTEDGETYHFTPMEMETATIIVHINTEGWGNIAFTEGEAAPEIDPDYPFQSAQINLAEPAVHTFTAWPKAGNLFVKWTKNGEDFSMEPQITVLLDESADFVAVFEEDSDWQNPVMNFIGEYQSGRAHAKVQCIDSDSALITIDWGGSAWELARWVIVGRLDTDTLTVAYSGCTKSILTYEDDGELKSEETEYEDGTGTILFSPEDNTFTWPEDQSDYGVDMVFEWLPVPVIDLGSSALYTDTDLYDAVLAIKCKFASWEGCELHSVRYAGDEANTEENLAWLNSLSEEGDYTQVAEFLSDFHSPVEDGPYAWEPDAEYTDYQWWLARTEGGDWEIVSWGY